MKTTLSVRTVDTTTTLNPPVPEDLNVWPDLGQPFPSLDAAFTHIENTEHKWRLALDLYSCTSDNGLPKAQHA